MGEQKQEYYESYEGNAEESYYRMPSTPPRTVGELLRVTRQRMGHELQEVASTLRIRLVYLKAIEDGRFDELPGSAYATGFLRSYSDFLGLDADEIVRRFKDEVAGHGRKSELYFPTPVQEGRAPGGTILLVALVLAGMAYGGWYYLSATDRSMLDLVPALPDRLVSLLDQLPWSTIAAPAPGDDRSAAAKPEAAKPETKPAIVATAPAPATAPSSLAVPPPSAAPAPIAAPASATTPPTNGTSLPGAILPPRPPVPPPAPAGQPAPQRVVVDAPAAPPASPAEETEMSPQEPTPLTPQSTALSNLPPRTPGSPETAATEPAADASATAAAPHATPQGRVYGSQNRTSRISLMAKQDSWVQVRDGNEQLFTRVLRPGDTYRLPERSGLKLRTGNAGGLVLLKDGVEGPPLGSVGQVLRDYPLESSAPASAPAPALAPTE